MRAVAWLAGVIAGLVLARLLGLVELAALSFAVLAALALDGAWFLLVTRRRPLALARPTIEAVPVGTRAKAAIEVSNPGTLQTLPCEIHWHNSTSAAAEQATYVNRGLLGVDLRHPGERLVVENELNTRHRGETTIAGTTLLTRSPLSIWTARLAIAPRGSVLVWPRLHALTSDGTPPSLGLSAEQAQVAVLSEPDGELAGLRPYVRGDDIRMIHWRTSARRNHPHVVQKEPPRTPDGVRIWLDTRIAPEAGAGVDRDFERSLSVAASVISHFAGRDLRSELVTPDVHIEGEPRELLNHLALLQPSTGGAGAPPERAVDLAIAPSRSSEVPAGCPSIACWTPTPQQDSGFPAPGADSLRVHWLEGEPLHETWRRLLEVLDHPGERSIRSRP